MRLRAALITAAFLTFTGQAAAQDVQPRIINGSHGDRIAYQAGLIDASGDPSDLFCGGTVRDATHVITAAHCVDGASAASIDVIADVVDLGCPGPPGCAPGGEPPDSTIQRVSLTAISTHPSWNPDTMQYDAALLTLESPGLALDRGAPSLVDPLPLGFSVPAAGSSAVVSGWGSTDPAGLDYPRELGWVEVKILSDASCGSAYGSDYSAETMLCAGEQGAPPTDDACFGDSGGPLASGSTIPGSPLVGIVSFGGQLCGDPSRPGVYTRVANPSIFSFLGGQPPQQPSNTGLPGISGTLAAGGQVTCSPGSWTGAQPIGFEFRWVRGDTQVGTGPGYTVADADQGQALTCIVRATNEGGSAEASTAVYVPAPPPPPPPIVPSVVDTTRPTSRFTVRRCRRRRCRLVVVARDPGGLRGATARVTMRRLTGCARGPRGRRCRRVRRLRVRSLGPGRFEVRTRRLAVARYRFTAVVTDAAGNRQRRATFVILRVGRR